MNGCQGFSLTEVVVSLAIAAILMGMAIPFFGSWTAGARLDASARDLASA
ncbi:MAG: prepilin-type N-terminal cleavage/methylation domain-containing protein, partial [Candidatus Omnitrophica bacterium]|nr:prepilin-type N-terminal cleavage/methylation domain-containing protein [Candidatus Omnitrophota bacterium]